MTRTSTENAVGMEAREAGRNAQKDPRIEARERLEAAMAKSDRFQVSRAVALQADLRTILSALSEAEGELDRMREALEPFAALGNFDAELTERWPERIANDDSDTVLAWTGGFDLKPPVITYSDLRNARAALSPTWRTGNDLRTDLRRPRRPRMARVSHSTRKGPIDERY